MGIRRGEARVSVIPRSPLGVAIETYRRSKNWEIRDLAKRSGVSIETIRRIERSQRARPTNDTLERLAKALDVDFEHLCHWRFVSLTNAPPLTIRSPLGRWLRRTRLILKISQKELAHRAKTTTKTIARIESDPGYKPSQKVLKRIAEALHVQPEPLLALRRASVPIPTT